jgi:hypothetical protein
VKGIGNFFKSVVCVPVKLWQFFTSKNPPNAP